MLWLENKISPNTHVVRPGPQLVVLFWNVTRT
jgi:hypothetical protein